MKSEFIQAVRASFSFQAERLFSSFSQASAEALGPILPEVRPHAIPMAMAKRTGHFPFLNRTSFTVRRLRRLPVNPPRSRALPQLLYLQHTQLPQAAAAIP